MNFLFDLEKDSVHAYSDAKDVKGKALIEFDISADGTITNPKIAGEAKLTPEELLSRQEALAWNIIYFFLAICVCGVGASYAYFKMT